MSLSQPPHCGRLIKTILAYTDEISCRLNNSVKLDQCKRVFIKNQQSKYNCLEWNNSHLETFVQIKS